MILDGGCEIAECCGVMARITIGDETVRWSGFWTSASRPVPTGLRFEFARGAYEAEIAAVRSAPRRRWADTLTAPGTSRICVSGPIFDVSDEFSPGGPSP